MTGVYHGREASEAALYARGPIIVGQLLPDPVTLDRLSRRGRLPLAQTVYLLIDTGADGSAIDHDVITALSLPSHDTAQIRGVTQHIVETQIYVAELSLWLVEGGGPAHSVHFPLRFAGLQPTQDGRHQGILGRDFLRSFDFNYRGPDGRFELTLR